MPTLPPALIRELKLLALKALPEMQRRGLSVKEAAKAQREGAIKYVVERYVQVEKNIPGLNVTDVDNKLIEAEATKAVDWAIDKIGGLLDGIIRDPVTDDQTLPQGGDEKHEEEPA